MPSHRPECRIRAGAKVTLTDTKRLEALIAACSSPQKHGLRARIILPTSQGIGTQAIRAATGTSKAILDNDATLKQPEIRSWRARHPRWTFDCLPTSCSCLKIIEGFCAKLTRRLLKNGAFHSVVDLQAAVNRFIKEHHQEPHPLVWKADPAEIIAAVRRGYQTLEAIQ